MGPIVNIWGKSATRETALIQLTLHPRRRNSSRLHGQRKNYGSQRGYLLKSSKYGKITAAVVVVLVVLLIFSLSFIATPQSYRLTRAGSRRVTVREEPRSYMVASHV